MRAEHDGVDTDDGCVWLAWCGLVAVLVGAFVRASCEREPFPWWSSDPYRFTPPITGLTPAWGLACDGLVVLGCGLVCWARRAWMPSWIGVPIACGLGVIAWHAATDAETVEDGATLAAGVCGMLGVWLASGLVGARRVIGGVCLGFGVMLAAVGTQELLIEHGDTVAWFEQNREAFFASRGWEIGGPEALMYEERLSHPNPTGAFGLTNVFATFAGASCLGLLAISVARGMGVARRVVFVIGALVCGWALVSTGSRGGIGAAALVGIGMVVVRARAGWGGLVAVLLAGGVVVGVAARGLLGDRIGEKSLLFRSQYQRGAARVWAEEPLLGVGAGRFQDTYSRLKPSGAVEDVLSTHSIWIDWIAMLGVGGVALVLASVLVWGRQRPAGEQGAGWRDEQPGDACGPGIRVLVRVVCGVIVCGVLGAVLTTREAITIEQAGAVLLGGLGWLAIGVGVCSWPGEGAVMRGAGLWLGGWCAGAVALVHGQLDVAGSWGVSAGAWGVLVGWGAGCTAGAWKTRSERATGGARGAITGLGSASACVVCLACAGLLAVLVWRGVAIARWSGRLDRAAGWARELGGARIELSAARTDLELRLVADRVSGWTGRAIPARGDAILGALDTIALWSHEEAAEGLRAAVAARPTHTGTRSALGQVLVTMSTRDEGVDPDRAVVWMDEAVDVARRGGELNPDDGASWVWLGRVLVLRGELAGRLGGSPDEVTGWLGEGGSAWREADERMPHDPGSAARLADHAVRVGDAEQVRIWAARALERDGRMSLDTSRGLSGPVRERMRALSGG